MRDAMIGALIRTARTEQRLSQERLAHMAGTAVQTISNIENARSRASLDVLERVTKSLGLPLQFLVAPELDDVEKRRVPHVASALAAMNAMSDEGLAAAAEQLSVLARHFPKPERD